jgi:hypothetical protein
LITAAYPCGPGRFVLNSLRILANPDRHPAVDRLLLTMITDALGGTRGARVSLPDDCDAQRGAIGYRASSPWHVSGL